MRGARTACVLGILAVAIGAAALRLPRLALRPMHGDEANQAVKTAILLETGRYAYDPHDHHGPTLYYLVLPVLWACGAETAPQVTDGHLRVVPAVFGVLVVLVLLLMGDGLGRPAALCAAVLTAVSPALVFYSRYYVQEMLLVCFTFAFLATAWRYVATRKAGWAVAAGACLGLMYATKETWVLAGASMVAALVLALLWERYGSQRDPHGRGRRLGVRPYLSGRAVIGALAAAAVVAGVLFTSFFAHPRGLLDSILTYYYNVTRVGAESLHDHPWYWHLAVLTYSPLVTGVWSGPWWAEWSEGLILGLALAGIVAALTGRGLGRTRRPLARFLAFYTIFLTAAYALIRYKTPWCACSFLHGMVLMAGIGAVAVVRWVPTRLLKVLVALVLVAGAVHLGWQAYLGSLTSRFCANQRNPYVYAHTAPDAMRLVRRVQEVAEVSPHGRDMIIKVITPENYWPLPWYLRGFNQDHVGYYHEVPDDCDASVIITSPEWTEQIDARTKDEYNRNCVYGLRPRVLMAVWIRQPLWDALVEKWSAEQQANAAVPGGSARGPTFAAAIARRVLFTAPSPGQGGSS